MALVEKAFGDIITFTRASGGGRINSLGEYEWVGTNVPRLTHDPVTLQPLGLLVEEQRTNLILHSANLANVAWSKGTGVSISTDGQLAPNGTPMQLITLAGTTNHHITQVLLAPLATGQAHTISVYVKPKSAPFPFQIAYYDGSSTLNSVLITPQPGVIQRIDFTFTPTVVAASPQIRILGFGNGGDGDQVYIWGVQLEQASAPSTYIPTTTEQVTRAADVCSVNTLSPWYNAMEGTLVVDGIPLSASGALANVVTLDDGTSNNRIHLRHTSTTSGSGIVLVAGVVQASFTSPANSWPIMASRKAAIAYKENSFAFSVSGGAPLTDSAGLVPAVSRMIIGAAPGYSSAFNGIISRITYYPRVIDVQQASA